MQIGDSVFMQAPGCVLPVKVPARELKRSVRRVFWTDGKEESSLFPPVLALRKSPNEGVLFWIEDCKLIASINEVDSSFVEENTDLDDVALAESPSEADYFKAIEDGMGDSPPRLRYLRMRCWWAGNDPIRRDPGQVHSAEQIANMDELIPILDPLNPGQRIMRAEIFREQGKFNAVRRLLKAKFPKMFETSKETILQLNEAGNTKVAPIEFGKKQKSDS